MSDIGKVRSAKEIRDIVRLAHSEIENDPGKKAAAIRNPISYLSRSPYNLSLHELAVAYDDPKLNAAHPDHPNFAEHTAGIGCILCGFAPPD